MKDIQLYQKVLGLQSPWYVVSVSVDELSEQITVIVECDEQAELSCPCCGKPANRYDKRQRQWRHLDTCQYQTLLQTLVPRVHCAEHGYRTLSVPWAQDKSRYTELFEARILTALSIASLHAVSRVYRLSWGTIDRIMQRAVTRGLTRPRKVDARALLVDETAFRKGHDYVTLLSNAQGQVLAVSDDRTAYSLRQCFQQLPAEALSQTVSISMDMSPAYLKATRAQWKDADNKIAIDHFHISKLLTEAVDAVRKRELIELSPSLRKEAHLTRYFWLKRRHHLTDMAKERLNQLVPSLLNTALAWLFKEQARDIWHGNRVRGAKQRWYDWIALVKAGAITPMINVAKTVEKHIRGILNAMRFGVSNALAEAINGKVRQLRVRAMGYRNKDRFKRAILFHFGGLDMGFHHK